MDINDNGVGLFVGFITRGIAAVCAACNTGKVTPLLLLRTIKIPRGYINTSLL